MIHKTEVSPELDTVVSFFSTFQESHSQSRVGNLRGLSYSLIGTQLKLYYESLFRHIKESPQLILRVLTKWDICPRAPLCDMYVFDLIYLILNSDSCYTSGV